MVAPEKTNYYEVLEIESSAAQHEISQAYQRAKATYSGENPAIYTIFSENEARELLSMIEEAFSILGNKTLRTIYDQRLFADSPGTQDLTYESILMASKVMFPESKPKETPVEFKKDPEMEKKISSTVDWDGSLIKEVREYKNYSVEKMNEITKINTWYITAIENMDTANLPAPVFIRGYVAQIAKVLNLNDKLVADSYMKAIKAKTK